MFIMGFILPDSLTTKLVSKLFMTNDTTSSHAKSISGQCEELKNRHPFKPSLQQLICPSFCKNSWQKRALRDGSEAIEKNLDVTRFIELQVMMRAAIRVLFDQNQRLLLKHNKRFVVPKKKDHMKQAKIEGNKASLEQLLEKAIEYESVKNES